MTRPQNRTADDISVRKFRMARLSQDVHPSLTPSVLSKLFSKSIFTILSFIRTNPELLTKISGLHYYQVLQVKDKILSKFSSTLKAGDKYYQEFLSHCAILPTGIENFDKLLNGGIETGNLYELCGFAGCGKTQLCMSLSVNLCRLSQHKVLYIDTKNDASGYRFHDIADQQNISNIGEIMQRINFCQVKSAYELLKDLSHLHKKLKAENCLGFRLVIIDSLSALFQKFHDQNESLSLLNNVASLLKCLCIEYHMVIFITNLVTTWTPDLASSDLELEEDFNVCRQIEHPGLGKFWAHVPNVRISLKKLAKGKNECLLIVLKSLNLPLGKSAKVKLTDKGVI